MITKELIDKYIEDGLIRTQSHPIYPLTIINYTDFVQYDGNWDWFLVMCRGLVIDDNFNIIARPLKKFWNIEENKHTPTADFDVYEKMDGSLGIIFWYNEWIVATRGSFTSDQSIKATELFNKLDKTNLNKNYTYCVEIIYKENRIVVDYGDDEKLVWLVTIDTKTGTEINDSCINWEMVKKYDGITDYSILKNIINDNQEGFVVRFSNGDRCKIKGEEYIKLHRIITNLTSYSVWDCLSSNMDISNILEGVPDEIYKNIHSFVDKLNNEYKLIENEYINIFNSINCDDRKEFALKSIKYKLSSILFHMKDNKDYSNLIWKHIKPNFFKL